MSKKRKTVAYKGYSEAVRRFDIEPSPGRERNRFSLLDKGRDTFNAGFLVPFMWFPVLPGDNLTFSPRFLVRLSNALVTPLMDEIELNVYFFLSYNRFVFDEWNQMMGEYDGEDPDYDNSGDNYGGAPIMEPPYNEPGAYELPTMAFSHTSSSPQLLFDVDSVYDHLGLPIKTYSGGYEIQTAVPRHCNHIWNEYFRDQNFQRPAPVPRTIGPDDKTQFKLMPVLKHRDYFTGSLPFLQKGPSVLLGLNGSVPVIQTPASEVTTSNLIRPNIYGNDAKLLTGTGARELDVGAQGTMQYLDVNGSGTHYGANFAFQADFTQAQSIALAQLRLAFQMQRFYEGQARSGTRYIEYVHFMFNEYIPDTQLQRPKFIGGSKFYINVNPVTQTSNTAGQSAGLGSLAAFGVAYHRDPHSARVHCQEHGYVIGFICARTPMSYSQGLDRDWSKRDRFDFYTPTLAHLVEQEVKNKELVCTGIPEYDNATFGYIGRYDEYRTIISRNKGWFRPEVNANLSSYHLGESWSIDNPGTSADGFPGLPHLNPNFLIQPQKPLNRAMGIGSDNPNVPQFLMDYAVEIRGSRVVSKYGIPGFADHF